VETDEKIKNLDEYKAKLSQWRRRQDDEIRVWINQNTVWARREIIDAGCYDTVNIYHAPEMGKPALKKVDPFTLIFSASYSNELITHVMDLIDKTIGVLKTPDHEVRPAKKEMAPDYVQKGYAFVAMPINPNDPALEDVLDAIKEAADRCGIHAERVDEPQYNERITDRILESIHKAEYVIVDLTGSRPNVFYEAGYAQGLRKTPIYIAREGTKLEFDLKDYPIIFFKSMKELKDLLEQRLRGLAKARAT
jgi:hypothetical protein